MKYFLTCHIPRSFFRKANFNEAIDSYTDLLKVLRRSEEEEYSGLVNVAIAKCHQQQSNTLMEALYYHRAAKFFADFQTGLKMTNSPTYQESAELGLECYLAAIEVYMELKKFAIAASLYYELGQFLVNLSRSTEASQYFEKAAELQQADNAMSAIVSLKKSFQCDVKNQNYTHATQVLQWIIKISTEQATLHSDSFYIDINIESSVSHVLILILLGDFQQAKIVVNHLQKEYGEQNFKQTANVEDQPIFADLYFTKNLYFALLDQLVDSVESYNEREVISIQSELKNVLSSIQNELFLKVLRIARSNNVK